MNQDDRRNKFEKVKGRLNEILDCDTFYISYNPEPIFDDIPMFNSDKESDETALYNRKTNIWYILNGDFRKAYLKVYKKGFKACLAVYKKNIKKRSSFSTD